MEGKVVLVTGASAGIGVQIAVHFAALGCRLTITGRNEASLEQTRQMCLREGLKEEQLLALTAELTEDEQVRGLVEQTLRRFHQLDVLVNNAGIMKLGTAAELPLSDLDEIMRVNVRSVFLLTQLCIPHLVASRGNVVNVSSICGLRAFPGCVAYNMTKAALDQLTRTCALELAAQGVRVNSVNPGVVQTELRTRAGMDPEAYLKYLEHQKTTHALGRVGTAEEVAQGVVFLADDRKAAFLTGVTLPIDGGRTVMCPR